MYATEEERIKALRASRNKYHKNKEWYCDICCKGKITQLEENIHI